MKLEAVDRRNPTLIRVASVEDVEDHRIKVPLGPSGWGSGQAGGQDFVDGAEVKGCGMSQTAGKLHVAGKGSKLEAEDLGSQSGLICDLTFESGQAPSLL